MIQAVTGLGNLPASQQLPNAKEAGRRQSGAGAAGFKVSLPSCRFLQLPPLLGTRAGSGIRAGGPMVRGADDGSGTDIWRGFSFSL